VHVGVFSINLEIFSILDCASSEKAEIIEAFGGSLGFFSPRIRLYAETSMDNTSTPSVPNYKSFQESWRVKVFQI